MATILREQVIRDGGKLQQKLYLPLSLVNDYSPIWCIEFHEKPAGLVQVVFVNPREPAFSKRYRVVRHHGSAWVSVPRTWLQHLDAQDGDKVVLFEDDGKLFLRHQKQEPVCR